MATFCEVRSKPRRSGATHAAQAFMNAVSAGIPFGEGLTRLVEGLRMAAFAHPRGALVRHIFQRHAPDRCGPNSYQSEDSKPVIW